MNVGGRSLDHQSTRAGFVLLGAFLLSFAFVRLSSRLIRSPRAPWWPGSVKTGSGLHVHHLVFGIVLLLLAGFLGLVLRPASPWLEVVSALFGVGAGLTLDEFALWLHLEDVYWAEEGRRSIDAVIVATVVGALILLGASPVDTSDTGSLIGLMLSLLIVLAVSTVALLKGKTVLGVAGLVLPILSLIGAIRLAEPGSPWARWRYPPDGRRMRRATARHTRYSRRYRRWQEWIGGAPSITAPGERPPP